MPCPVCCHAVLPCPEHPKPNGGIKATSYIQADSRATAQHNAPCGPLIWLCRLDGPSGLDDPPCGATSCHQSSTPRDPHNPCPPVRPAVLLPAATLHAREQLLSWLSRPGTHKLCRRVIHRSPGRCIDPTRRYLAPLWHGHLLPNRGSDRSKLRYPSKPPASSADD